MNLPMQAQNVQPTHHREHIRPWKIADALLSEKNFPQFCLILKYCGAKG